MPVPEHIAKSAAEIQSRHNARVQAAQQDRDITDEARLKRLAESYIQANEAMGDLRQGFQSSREGTVTKVSQDIFGAVSTSGVDAISARDADDRAAQIQDPDEAQRLLANAEQNGDQVLARAIAKRAHEGSRSDPLVGSHWDQVLEHYTSTRPNVAAKLEQLEQASASSVRDGMFEAATFSVQMPREIERLNPYRITGRA